MIINDPTLPKSKYGWFINERKCIRFGVVNPYYFKQGIIEIAPLTENSCINNIEKYIAIANKSTFCYLVYTRVNRKDFFATKQQAEHALKTRTK